MDKSLKARTIAAFPVGAKVRPKPDRRPGFVEGTVTGHYGYNLAMVGYRVFVEVADQKGRILGEFRPESIERVD